MEIFKMVSLTELDVEGLRLRSDSSTGVALRPPRRVKGRFLRGPVAMTWLETAGALPGKSLHVALGLRYLAGMNDSLRVRLSPIVLRRLGVSRYSAYRALEHLATSGLVRVTRRTGASPLVEIVEPSGDSAATEAATE